MTLDLGIDAGGSKAAWSARDATGVERAQGVAAAIQAAAMEPRAVALALRAIVEEASAASGMPVVSVVAGLAGAGLPRVRRAIRDAVAVTFRSGIRFAVVGDVEVAAATCLARGEGVAIWAGTGSFAVARAPDGSLHRAGGRGLLLDDRGGAASIVLAAARAALESDDSVIGPTSLSAVLAASFGASRARELGRVLRDLPAGELAQRLPLVAGSASRGDAIAAAVLADEAGRLADRAVAATRRASIPLASCSLNLGGGAVTHCVELREALCAALRARGFGRVPAEAPPAVDGAVRLAGAHREGRRPLCDWLEDDHAA